MAKAVPSDGKVNGLFLQMARQGLPKDRNSVDEVLVEAKLKQCKYETLIALQDAYITAYNDKSWSVHFQICIKAEQSSSWREWRDQNKKSASVSPESIISNDPLKELQEA